MRLRNNPEATNELIESGMLIQNFPYKITEDVIVELGMGKGEMITEMASLNPDKTYLGIERFATVAAKAAKRAEKLGLKNFFIICEDIKDLPELLNGNVKTMWLTFSDPWPKARHEKRRLTHKAFLDHYKAILGSEGTLRFKTDNDKLFEYSLESLEGYGAKLNNITRDLHNFKVITDNVKTGYEVKWSSTGKNINYLEAKF